MKSVKGTRTEKNLLTSFAGESQARMRYTYFASAAKKEGYEAAVLFVIQMKGVKEFRPNEERDRVFTEALREAVAAGVKILAYDCNVAVGKVNISEKISVKLQ